MAEILNVTSLLRKLSDRQKQSLTSHKASVIVGFTANYSLYVHENLEAAHGTAYNVKYAQAIEEGLIDSATGRPYHTRGENQQAKFLETPLRLNKGRIAEIVAEKMKAGATLIQALLVAGMFLQRESMKIVPVDTGNLRASAFTRDESGGNE